MSVIEMCRLCREVSGGAKPIVDALPLSQRTATVSPETTAATATANDFVRIEFPAILIVCLVACTSQAVELEQKDVEVYGFNIHYGEAGSGPALILLHGLWGGTNEWQAIIGPLAKKHRVIAMDFLGFHGSAKPEAQYHNALLSQFLTGFIDALGLEDVTLIGHAMGANAATYTAFHHPQNIARLVLVDGAGYHNPDRDLSQPMSAGMINFRRIATGSSVDATERFLKRRVKDPSLVTREWAEHAFHLWLDSARAIGDMLREGGDLTEEEMRQIDLPTLVIWGAEDKVFPIANAERLRTDIEGSEVHIIEDAGHLPQLEQTEAFLDVLLPFLEEQ
jgi:pimeloyl-ACP methyl ester carboxylesterase